MSESATDARKSGKKKKGEDVFDSSQTFKDIGLRDSVLKSLDAEGFSKPTMIQAKLIPLVLAGRDVIGQAKTGTGKTAAFGLPLLHMVEKEGAFQAVVLAPTRELAIQIRDEMTKWGKHTPLKVVPVYGGQKISVQRDKLEKGPHIVVGTPGRVLDMIGRGYLRLDNVKFAVLDEVDRMFDIGFRDDIIKFLRKCPEDRQTIFVSATMSPEIEDLARRYMRDPEKVVTTSGSLTVQLVEQHYLTVAPWDKKRLLHHLLTHEEPALTLVFCRLKRTCDELARFLTKKGVETHAIHADMSQGRRNATMKEMKAGNLSVLVASDLASRGIDVQGISHVINYDLPDDPDLYVHRIGRTARLDRDGVAWSFVTPEQGKQLTMIEDLINAEIPMLEYPDFEEGEKPDNWKPEPTGGRPIAEVEGVPEAQSRFTGPEVPPKEKIDEKTMAAKFPGGVVPSKLPPKRMGGRARTRR